MGWMVAARGARPDSGPVAVASAILHEMDSLLF